MDIPCEKNNSLKRTPKVDPRGSSVFLDSLKSGHFSKRYTHWYVHSNSVCLRDS